ncbi:hypothetical protein DSM107007_24390 [Nostoc sp. PCC 7120 = FACHB-418]|nr:hypothetical protein DSM107007_24390 [Nostoc sp. PCC 7120 = FACHB-418]
MQLPLPFVGKNPRIDGTSERRLSFEHRHRKHRTHLHTVDTVQHKRRMYENVSQKLEA